MWIPDPGLESAWMLTPNTPPIGKVAINWDHPEARGLDAYILATSLGLVDVVSGTVIARGGVSVKHGRWVWNPTADNDDTSIVFPNGSFELDVDGPSTYLQSIVPTSQTFDWAGTARWGSNDIYGLLYRNTSTTIAINCGSSSALEVSYPTNDPLTVVSLLDLNNNPGYFYGNGEYLGTRTRTYAYSGTGNPRCNINSNIHLLAQWKGWWKDAGKLSRDPYCVLMQAH